jgi:hypothetical protein
VKLFRTYSYDNIGDYGKRRFNRVIGQKPNWRVEEKVGERVEHECVETTKDLCWEEKMRQGEMGTLQWGQGNPDDAEEREDSAKVALTSNPEVVAFLTS